MTVRDRTLEETDTVTGETSRNKVRRGVGRGVTLVVEERSP